MSFLYVPMCGGGQGQFGYIGSSYGHGGGGHHVSLCGHGQLGPAGHVSGSGDVVFTSATVEDSGSFVVVTSSVENSFVSVCHWNFWCS